jgi:hypothetical protein
MKPFVVLISLLIATPLSAQTETAASSNQEEGAFQAELRREGERLREKCSELNLKQLGNCAVALATDHPLHLTLGTLAPLNGVGFGPALVMHHTPNENWRLNWSADFAGAFSGAWRTGAYFKAVRTAVQAPVLGGAGTSSSDVGIHPYPVFDGYAQTLSLPKLAYYGIGPDTSRTGKSFYGMRETIIGGSVIYPITRGGDVIRRLNLSVLGEINNRLVDVRDAHESGAPSIEQLYSELTAPGLTNQPGFAQFGEGVRIKPSLADGHVQLNYVTKFQQFVASDSQYSFRRWTVDLGHEIPLYRNSSRPGPRDTNNPNDCSTNLAAPTCPAVSRNRTGAVNLRLLVSRSFVSDASVVPFYFQPTLGGSDINGSRMLPSYDDYRFRGPHVLLLQESFEHSIGDWPVGVWIASDQGRVSLQEDNGDAGTFRKTFAAGLTLRAGGFPAVLFSWGTGDSEGHHVAITISTSVLGGSSRPSLY